MEFKRRGSLSIPSSPVTFKIKCTIEDPLYTNNQKKYLGLHLPDSFIRKIEDIHSRSEHLLTKRNVSPLQENVLKIKVPYKFNRVTCKVTGNKIVQDLVKGDIVTVNMEFCGVWDVGDFCGMSWKLTMIET